MLSGSSPRGNSSAPARGNSRSVRGSSSVERYGLFMLMPRPSPRRRSSPLRTTSASREEQRRQLPARRHGRLVSRPPCLEELHQLLAGAIVVPTTVAPNNVKKLGCGFVTQPLRVEGQGEIEARLGVFGISQRAAPQFLYPAQRARLPRVLER